jgi:sugar-specific transcriptional regulator TrmB
MIAIPIPALLAWGMSRTRRYDSLQVLEKKGLVNHKEKGMVYINPNLVYRGRAENYSRAVEAWMRLGGE